MKHYIIIKFDNTFNYLERIPEITNLFNEALNIVGIKKISIFRSNSKLNNRYDLMIKMVLTHSALNEFDNSWIHKQWKNDYGRYIKDKTIFDCD